jgi:hypothetical protein
MKNKIKNKKKGGKCLSLVLVKVVFPLNKA